MKRGKKNKTRNCSVTKIKNSTSWKTAEFEHTSLVAMSMMPFGLGDLPSVDEKIELLSEILDGCPSYYPAMFELGIYKLSSGNSGTAHDDLLKATKLTLELEKNIEDVKEYFEQVADNLENNFMYGVLCEMMKQVIEKYPDQGRFYDTLAYALMHVGCEQDALKMAQRAVELEPSNSHFNSNLGWINMVAGNHDDAERALTRSLSIKKNNDITKGNLKILKFIQKGNCTVLDFFLRPTDKRKLARLEEKGEESGDFEKLDTFVSGYNGDRMYAWQWDLCKNETMEDNAGAASSLKAFFGFVNNISLDSYLLYEDVSYFDRYFKIIMHKFIFKMSDVDETIIDEIYSGLLSFYDFLARNNVIDSNDFNRFKINILNMKEELLKKMERYNSIRHDSSIDNKTKEGIRDDIFEGDHWWPSL